MIQIRVNLISSDNNTPTLLELPCRDSEMQEKLEEARIHTDAGMPRARIQVLEPEELWELTDRTVKLDELNFLAKRLDSFTVLEQQRFAEAVELTKCDTLRKMINLTFNLEKFVLIQDISSPAKIGLAYALQQEAAVPVDYGQTEACAELGKILVASGKGMLTNRGLLFLDDRPMEDVYDGVTFPEYDWEGSSLVTVIVEYNGSSEYLYLPCEELAIEKARVRLGAPILDDVVVTVDGFSGLTAAWVNRIGSIIDREGLLAANELLKRLMDTSIDLEKLDIIAQYAHVETAQNLVFLLEHEDSFVYVDWLSNDEEIGHYFTEKEPEYYLSTEMRDYFDYAAFGKHMREWKHGEMINGGFLFYTGELPVQDLLAGLEPEDPHYHMTMV